MFINDVGQSTTEEINDGIRGANYGWPESEGPTSNPNHRGPLFWYGHGSSGTTGCAITGGSFYNPTTANFPPSFTGQYFFADFCSGWIRKVDPANGFAATGFATGINSPVDLRVAADGALWYLERGTGSVWRVEFTDDQAPQVTAHPANVTVSAGQPASFSVSASGTAPLSFQWQRDGVNIAGATSSTYTLAAAQLSDNGATFRAVVTNTFGNDVSNAAVLTVTANNAPTASITTPANGTFYTGGETITYAGTGVDPGERQPARLRVHLAGGLPPRHARAPVHPGDDGCDERLLRDPQTGETETNVFYRVILTVRDPQGLASTTSVDLVPRVVTVNLAANPTGLQVTLDGQPVTTPFAAQGVVGVRRTLGAPSPQTSGSTSYVFQSWSDGGAQTHEIVTPATSTTYTASFTSSTVPPGIGLAGYYYDNINFTGATVTRLDPTVNFDWASGAPVAGIGADTFSVRWSGQVRAKVTGTTTFFTTSDDGVRLFVNNVLVVDNWTDHAPTENSGTIALAAGVKYDVRMETYENGGLAVAKLAWSGPGLAKEFVPQTHLYPYALLVTASTTLGAGDAAVRDRLTATGFTPLVRAASAVATSEAAGKALVLLSSTPASTQVNTKFRTVVTPVLNWESALMDDLGLTGPTSGTHYGTATGQTQVAIVNAAHPLAAGLTGTVAVNSAGAIHSWGVPNANAATVARPVGQAGRAAIFGYEKGSIMPGLVAPGRRVGFFLEDATAGSLTTQGRALLDAAVRWVTGR